VAFATQALAPGHRQVPAVQLDVGHRPGRRAAVVGRPAVVAAAEGRCGVPQVAVVVRDQRRGAVLSGQHGLPGRRGSAGSCGGGGRGRGRGRHRRGPDDRRRALDQQRRGLLAAPVTAVRRRLGGHGPSAFLAALHPRLIT